MNSIYTIWLREMKRFLRSKSRIFGNLSFPIVWLGLLGVGLNSAFAIPNMQGNYLNFMAPGIIGMTLLFTSIFSGISIIYDRQFGFLKEILVAPVSRISIVLGKILSTATIAVFNGLIILIFSLILGAIPLKNISIGNIGASILFMALTSVCFVSLGLAIASKLNSMEGFQMIASFLVMPMFFLSGAFFPIENVPGWMKILAHLDPLMYGVDGLRASILGFSQYAIWTDLAILASIAVGMIIISGALFRKMGIK